jgi:hypothetical protein
MKYVIHPMHSILHTLYVTYIPYVKLNLIVFILFAHIILFLLITGEYADFTDISFKKSV